MDSLTAGPGRGCDPGGAHVRPIGGAEVAELEKLLASARIGHVDLRDRYTVIFVYPGVGVGDTYPELAGCTQEVCTFADRATEFVKHGFQLAGLSTVPTPPRGDFLLALPFPVGVLPTDSVSPIVDFEERGDERFASRRSFVVFPDRTGVTVTGITDPVAHVTRCFDTAIARRLQSYERAVIDHLQRTGGGFESTLEHQGFLANGADSVSISRVDLGVRLAVKLADPAIVAQEGGYMTRINRLLEEAGRSPLFPTVYTVCDDERPGYYLMEAVDPQTLDHLLFTDETMTTLRRERSHLLGDAVAKLADLHELTLRSEEAPIARYHYLDRFLAIADRRDFQRTFDLLLGGSRSLREMLRTPIVVEGEALCHSFIDQMTFLREHIDQLAQPAGAYLHGDVHLKNMLVGPDDDVIFIDPRIVWDGNDVGDPGFGDPLYDYGTLLHSLHTMAAVLGAIERSETPDLLTVEDDALDSDGPLAVWPGVLQITGSRTVDWLVDRLERTVPPVVRGANWVPRLHVNAANALFGWLKYARSVQTRHAWFAIYASVLYHLELARRQLQH